MKTTIIIAILATAMVAGAQERRRDYFWADMDAVNANTERMRRDIRESQDRSSREAAASSAAVDAMLAAQRAHMDAQAIIDAINASKK